MNLKKILLTQTVKNQNAHAYLVVGQIKLEEIINIFKVNLADLFIIDENPIKISKIRELIKWSVLKPHSSKVKLAMLLNIENMSLDAANSLLKLLEEPPKDSVIILQSTKKERILPTIISRCQIVVETEKQDINETEEASKIQDFISSDEITKKNIKERFNLANKLAESPNLKEILNLYEKEYRRKMLNGFESSEILKVIARDRSLLLSNISVKLLLENLLLMF